MTEQQLEQHRQAAAVASVATADLGISPVLLQAITQTLATTTVDNDVTHVTTTSIAPIADRLHRYGAAAQLCSPDGGGSNGSDRLHDFAGEPVSASGGMPADSSGVIGAGAGEPRGGGNGDGGRGSENHLIIKVIGDNFGDPDKHSAIMQQLRQRLGTKVIVQMETTSGNIVYEDTVTPLRPHADDSEDHSRGYSDGGDDSACPDTAASYGADDTGAVKTDDDVESIVNSVITTIRSLSAKTAKSQQQQQLHPGQQPHPLLKDCPICGDQVSGFHYGVQTCESCKGFFKRTVQNKKAFSCHRSSSCEVTLANRKKCPSCRFNRCVDAGMKIEGIREDRARGGRSSYNGASMLYRKRDDILSVASPSSLPPKRPRQSSTPETASASQAAAAAAATLYRMPFTQPVIPQLIQDIYNLETLYEESNQMPQSCCLDKLTQTDGNKFSSMLHLTEHRLYQIVRWARHLPDFLSIHTDDQILMLQNAWAELVCLGAIWRSRATPGIVHLSFGKTIDIKKAREMDHEECISRMLHVCNNFRRLQIDKYEYICLKVLALMLPDIKGLKEAGVIQNYQNRLLDALLIYTTSHYPQMQTKYGETLMRLSEVQRLTAITRQQIMHKTASGEVPEYGLLMELLKGQGYTMPGHRGAGGVGDQPPSPTEANPSTTTLS